MAKQNNNASLKAEAEAAELKKYTALAKANGIAVTEDDTVDSLKSKLEKTGIEQSESQKPKTSDESPEAGSIAEEDSERPLGIPAKARQVKCTNAEAIDYQNRKKLVGFNEKTGLAWIIPALFLAFTMLFGSSAQAASVSSTAESVFGVERWEVQNDGDIIPLTDSSFDIGASGAEVDNVYVDSIWIGGTEVTGVSQITTPMEDAGTYTRPIDAGDNIKLFDNGNLTITGDLAGDMLTLENGGVLDNASNNAVTLAENSDTLTITFDGSNVEVDSSDGAFQFQMTSSSEGSVQFLTNNDTDDYVEVSTSSNQPLINFVGSNGKITAESGTIDFDNENLTTTGTVSSGATTVTSLIIGDETFSRPADDEFRLASNDVGTTLEIYATGASNEDATLSLIADNSGDNGDEWDIVSDGGTNDIIFQNDTSGTMVTKFAVATTGIATFENDLTLESDDVLDNSTDDKFAFVSNDENTTLEIVGFEAKDAFLDLSADQSDDNGDTWRLESDLTTNDLIIQNDTSGSQAAKLTIADTSGDVTLTGDIINENADSLLMNTDDILVFSSNDESATYQALGFEAKDAVLQLWADQGDDAADKWAFTSNQSGNALTIMNGATTLYSIAASGGAITGPTSDVISFGTDDQLSFESEDEVSVIRALGFEAKGAALKLYADQDDDATDGWQLLATTSGTLTIGNDSGAAGTDVAKITITGSSGNTAFVGDVSGDGGDQLYGFRKEQVAITTASITTAQAGVTFVGDSADVIVLPEASTCLGCRFTFISGTADDVDIDPADGTDQFGPCSVDAAAIDGGAGDEYRMTDIGTSITVEAIGNDLWAVVSHNGAITDVN